MVFLTCNEDMLRKKSNFFIRFAFIKCCLTFPLGILEEPSATTTFIELGFSRASWTFEAKQHMVESGQTPVSDVVLAKRMKGTAAS